jgi:hypothetical protein
VEKAQQGDYWTRIIVRDSAGVDYYDGEEID